MIPYDFALSLENQPHAVQARISKALSQAPTSQLEEPISAGISRPLQQVFVVENLRITRTFAYNEPATSNEWAGLNNIFTLIEPLD